MPINRLVSLPLISVFVMLLAGCFYATEPAQFYMLEPIHSVDNKDPSDQPKMLIALAAVRIPQYADRPQIVSATAQHAYQLSELNRWAEDLDENITRVLVENLSALVPAEVLLANTSNFAKQAKYRLSVNILEFHVDPQGQARLTAQWQLTQGDKKLLSQQKSFHAPASTLDHALMVAALNDCLNRMSQDMATLLRQIHKAEQS